MEPVSPVAAPPCALARQRRPPPVRACRRRVDGRRDARPPRDRPGPWPHGPGAARRREPAVRLVVRPAGLAAGDARAAVVGRGGPAGEPGASAPPHRPPPDGLLGGRRVRGPVRRGLRARRLRHHAVLDAHGPAPAADADRAAASCCSPGPITLLLQASTPEVRRRWILPVLHSTVVRRLSFPVVSWIVFAAVMWASHFSPLFDLALENPWAHRLEHALFLVAALLFWWPVIGPDPSPWKLKPSARILYAGLAMPQNTFLALAIYMASAPAVRALRDDQPHLGPHAARGPAGRRRDHVGRRGHRVHHDPDRDDLAVDARRGAPERRRGSAARGGARGDPRARGPSRGQARGRGGAPASPAPVGGEPGARSPPG